MEMNQDVKKFMEVAAEYCRHRAEPSARDLERYLEILAASNDLDIFKSCALNSCNFYVTLHDLLNILNVDSTLLWPAIAVLQKICESNKTKMSVIQSYKFIPVLTRFMDASLPNEKLLKLLKLLANLTYGVKVAWQESHLPVLIETLTQIISGNKALLSPSLTILANLCYKNTPALYVLTRKVEIKAFIKSLAAMNGDLSVRVQVCKLLMIFGELNGQMPAEDILHFVDVTFHCVTEAFRTRDASTMRQIVDFFRDVNSDAQLHRIISRYPKTHEDTKRLIGLLESAENDDQNCVAILLEFIPTVFKINPQKTVKLLERLLTKITTLIHNPVMFVPVLNILLMITQVLNSEDQIFDLFPFDFLLKSGMDLENQKEGSTLVVAVLAEVCSISPSFRNQILESNCKDLIVDLFEKLFRTKFFYENCLSEENDSNKLCIQLIFLTTTLSSFSDEWKILNSELLAKKETLCSIAVAILNGDKTTRLRALSLINSLDSFSLSGLCDTMNEMRQSFVSNNDESGPRLEWVSISSSEQRVKELLETFTNGEANSSTVAELYEYKLSEMGQSERHLKTALDAADKRCVSLNHRVAQLRNQVAKLHQSLFDTQQILEGRSAEKTELTKQLADVRSAHAQEKKIQIQQVKKLAATIQDLENVVKRKEADINSLDGLLTEHQDKLQELTIAHESVVARFEEQKIQLSGVMAQLDEEIRVKELLNDELENCKKEIADRNAEIEECRAENSGLKDSLAKSLETISQKEEIIAGCEKQIIHLEHIREAVISVARNQKI